MKSYKKERESIILKKEPEKTINFQQLSTISLLIMLIVKHNYSDLNQLCWSISHCFKSINKYQVVWILTLWSLIFLEIINLSIKPCQLKELNKTSQGLSQELSLSNTYLQNKKNSIRKLIKNCLHFMKSLRYVVMTQFDNHFIILHRI